MIALVWRTARRCRTLARFLRSPLFLFMLLAGCGPAVTETTAAPQLTIVLTAAVGGALGCFIASPDPASVGAGKPFNFKNNTTVVLELIRRGTGTSLTTAPASGVSPTIVLHTVLNHEDYYGKSCATGIHTIALAP